MEWNEEQKLQFIENFKYWYQIIRRERKIKRDDFLKDSCIGKNTITRWIKGYTETPQKGTISDLCEYLKIPAEALTLPLNDFIRVYEIYQLSLEEYQNMTVERILKRAKREEITERQEKYTDLTRKCFAEYGISENFLHFLLCDTAFFHVKAPADGEAYPYHFKDDSGKIRDCVFHASDFIYIKMLQDTITSQIDDKKSTREGGGGTAVLL